MSRQIEGKPKNLDDLRYMAERGQLPEGMNVDDDDLQKLMRGEKVKIKGLGKSDGTSEEAPNYSKLNKDELVAEVASRVDSGGQPLSTDGTKDELIARLEENDAEED